MSGGVWLSRDLAVTLAFVFLQGRPVEWFGAFFSLVEEGLRAGVRYGFGVAYQQFLLQRIFQAGEEANQISEIL